MCDNPKDNLRLRCPCCLKREIDVVLLKNKNGYYCIKCSFIGSYEEIMEQYKQISNQYHLKLKRLTLEDIEKL